MIEGMGGMTIERVGSSANQLSDIQPSRAERSQPSEKLTNEIKERNMELATNYSRQPTREDIEQAVNRVNNFLEPVRRNLKFELHDKLDKYYVTVIDSSTDEVLKEIPPKEMLDMYAEMVEFMGLLVDRKI
jgi:flagellar protein FlaG